MKKTKAKIRIHCYICRNFVNDNGDFSDNICDTCSSVRDTNPVLFDFFINLIENKVEEKMDAHISSYEHNRSYYG